MPADDAVPAVEVVLDIEEVHRAALAFDKAGALAEELGHHLVHARPQKERVGMVAIGGDDGITRFLHRLIEQAGCDRFLADVGVQVSADLALAEAAVAGILEEADVDHLFIEGKELFGRYTGALALGSGGRSPLPSATLRCRHQFLASTCAAAE